MTRSPADPSGFGAQLAAGVTDLSESDSAILDRLRPRLEAWANQNTPPTRPTRKELRAALIAGTVLLGALVLLGVAAFWSTADGAWNWWSLTIGGIALLTGIVGVGMLQHNRSTLTLERHRQRAVSINRLVSAAESTITFELRKRRAPFTQPAPGPQPYGVSHEGAEALVAAWMRHLGEPSASQTRFNRDGGIDVAGARYIAQVKNYAGSVGVAAVREFVGVQSIDKRQGLIFTSGTFTPEAISTADAAQIALLRYDAASGTLTGVNPAGRDVRRRGLSAQAD